MRLYDPKTETATAIGKGDFLHINIPAQELRIERRIGGYWLQFWGNGERNEAFPFPSVVDRRQAEAYADLVIFAAGHEAVPHRSSDSEVVIQVWPRS